jgi:hypothetical protein
MRQLVNLPVWRGEWISSSSELIDTSNVDPLRGNEIVGAGFDTFSSLCGTSMSRSDETAQDRPARVSIGRVDLYRRSSGAPSLMQYHRAIS